jgi:CRP-like cAMP-binding protein
MTILHGPRLNCLLAAIPETEYNRIAGDLEPVSLPRTTVLYDFNDHLEYIYFPVTLTASLICSMEDGSSVEVSEVGNEGVLDISVLLGGEGALTQAVVQTDGQAYRMSTMRLRRELSRGGALQHVLMRYTQTLIAQMAQTTGCVRRHSVEQQLCRCLLLNFDRTHSRNLSMTQEAMANMLGVRRESVSEAATRLQSAGYISYKRGHIEVLNRSGLENQACECYDFVKKEFDRLRADLLPC